jgi:hypothetical protein
MRMEANAADFAQLAELWERAPTICREEMLRAMTDSTVLLQGEIQQGLPRGAGGAAGLAGSIQREEEVLADNVIGLVSSALPYAAYVETGTRPHAVGPIGIQALADWVEAKLGIGGEEGTGIAHAIAWKIRHHGTKANPVWQQTYERLQDTLRKKFNDAVTRILGRLAGGAA